MFDPPVWPDVGPSGVLHEGPRRELTVGPGMVQLGCRDYARAERTWEREHGHHGVIWPRNAQLALLDEDAEPATDTDAQQRLGYRESRRMARIDEHARRAVEAADWVPVVEHLVRHALASGAVTYPEVDDYRWGLLAQFAALPDPGRRLPVPADAVWDFDWTRPCKSRGRITKWSRRSRARMVKRMVELDWTPLAGSGRPFAMVTLLAPADSLAVFPTRDAWNAAFERFATRYERSWGEPLTMFWKHEYQRRGAPHLHGLAAPPLGLSERRFANGGLPFRQWLSITWAQCSHVPGRVPDKEGRSEFDKHVAAGTGVDYAEGLRASDPKRAAVYFLGHNSAGHKDGKEYQHRPPAEWLDAGKVGRFWGRRGLKRAVQTVEMSPEDYVQAVRTVRRWSRAQGRTKRVARARVTTTGPDTGRVRYRMQTVRLMFCQQGAGWVAVNDGAGFASQLARWIDLTHDQEHTGDQERRADEQQRPDGEAAGRSTAGDAQVHVRAHGAGDPPHGPATPGAVLGVLVGPVDGCGPAATSGPAPRAGDGSGEAGAAPDERDPGAAGSAAGHRLAGTAPHGPLLPRPQDPPVPLHRGTGGVGCVAGGDRGTPRHAERAVPGSGDVAAEEPTRPERAHLDGTRGHPGRPSGVAALGPVVGRENCPR